jgi:hypothetical protein
MCTYRQQLRALTRRIPLACALALCSACTATTRHTTPSGASWQQVPLRPQTPTDVTQSSGVVTRFARVRLVGDTLYGWRSPFRRDRNDSVSIPTVRVAAVTQYRTNWGVTFAVILGTFAVVVAYFVAVFASIKDY